MATKSIIETASDPHHVKSPLSGTNPSHSNNNNNNSRPASRTGSFKGPFKSGGGGLISLLLCCTFGAGSLLDNSDKSAFFSRHRKKNNNRHSTSADTHSPVVEKNNISPSSSPSPPTSAPALPKIFTHPTDLAHFSSSAAATSSSPTDQQEDPPVTSATPCSIPPQSPDVSSNGVACKRGKKGGVISCMNCILICWMNIYYRVRSCGFCRPWLQIILDVNVWY